MTNASQKKTLELLAPAKDFAHGRAVLLCGADAIYIGAPRFGARSAAGASVEDISKLCDLAHLYGARVYVAMNTLLYDSELEAARKVAWQMYDAGADALIVQDLAFAAMDDMPPIALHSSTQMCNNDPRRVAFLASSGFSRVILERAMSLEDMAAVRASCDVDLEAFVHGAICVCNSGRCYMSLSMGGGRSGNRGDCMQSCRMPYDLLDENLVRVKGFDRKYLLSVSDMNRSDDLRAMVDVGVSSFKIEGRLKDMNYVKNVVSYYRRELDALIAADSSLARASCGCSELTFEPDPAKSFARGAVDYFLHSRRGAIANFDTPKSMGSYVGTVRERRGDYFVMEEASGQLSGGDGICFYDRSGKLCGTNINNSDGRAIHPNRADDIVVGTKVYKNFDKKFSAAVEAFEPRRVIDVEAIFSFDKSALSLCLEARGVRVDYRLENEFSSARNRELAARTIDTQLRKRGHEALVISSLEIVGDDLPFVAVSVLNSLRRESLEMLERAIVEAHQREERVATTAIESYPYRRVEADDSVVNEISRNFLTDRGVETIDQASESLRSYDGARVMTCRYCLRRETGACLKSTGADYKKAIPRGDLYIRTGPHTYKLGFDCKKCEMYIYKYGE